MTLCGCGNWGHSVTSGRDQKSGASGWVGRARLWLTPRNTFGRLSVVCFRFEALACVPAFRTGWAEPGVSSYVGPGPECLAKGSRLLPAPRAASSVLTICAGTSPPGCLSVKSTEYLAQSSPGTKEAGDLVFICASFFCLFVCFLPYPQVASLSTSCLPDP